MRRDDFCSVFEVCKFQFQLVIQFGSKGKVIGEYYTAQRKSEELLLTLGLIND